MIEFLLNNNQSIIFISMIVFLSRHIWFEYFKTGNKMTDTQLMESFIEFNRHAQTRFPKHFDRKVV